MQPENAVGASVASPTPVTRGGCLSTVLVFVIMANALTSLVYLLLPDRILAGAPGLARWELYALAMLALANVVFAVLIWNWRRIGLWGVIASSLIVFAINMSVHPGPLDFVGLILPLVLAVLLRPRWAHLQ